MAIAMLFYIHAHLFTYELKLAANNRRRKDLYSLSLADQEILKEIKWNEKIGLADLAIRKNAALLKRVVAEPEIFMNNGPLEDDGEEEGDHDDVTMASHHHGMLKPELSGGGRLICRH